MWCWRFPKELGYLGYLWSDAAQLNRDFNKLATFHSSYENYVDKGTPRVARRWEAIHEFYQLSVMQLLIKMSQKQWG